MSGYIDNANADHKTCTGYLVTMNGKVSDPKYPVNWDQTKNWKITTTARNGDIMEMVLDLDLLKLTFKLNDEFYTEFENIEKTSYKAAGGIGSLEGFTLISYRDIYS